MGALLIVFGLIVLVLIVIFLLAASGLLIPTVQAETGIVSTGQSIYQGYQTWQSINNFLGGH